MPSSRDSEHARRVKEEAQEEQEQEKERTKKEEVHIGVDAERVLQLEHIATLKFSGVGTRARREAIERAVSYRLEDGACDVDGWLRPNPQRFSLDEDEISVNPRADPNGSQ